MIDASTLSRAISGYNGVVSLPVVLGHLRAPGMEETLTLSYSSDVQSEAVRWNADSPTGVAGLGWSVGLSFIARLPATSVTESDQRLVMAVRGQRSPLIRTGTASDGAALYAPTIALPWRIRFYAADERWLITTEQGETLILGDRHSGRQTVGQRVVWGNWFGASGSNAHQQQAAAMWLLSERKNQFGEGFHYSYDLTTAIAGKANGASYMQAAYLQTIASTTGQSLQLTYGDKQAGTEYIVPHTNPLPPNAFQSLYQTKFLQKVGRVSSSGTTSATVELLYDADGGGTAFLGSGALSKRLLTGLKRSFATGAAQPPLKFSYWGQDPADAVTPTAPFNTTTGGLYGAVKSVLLPEGGTALFTYAAIVPQYGALDAAVAPPLATAGTPRVAIENDFSAVTWLAAGNASLTLQAYWWEGRWIAATLDTIPCANAGAYAAMPIKTSRTVLALFSATQLHLYRPAPGRPGAWISPSVTQGGTTVDYYTPAITAGEPVALATGADFAGLLGLTSGQLFLYRFDGLAWQALAAVSIGSGQQALAASASETVLLAASVPKNLSGASITLDLFSNADGVVSHQTLSFSNLQPRSSGIFLVQGDGFAVVRVDTSVGSGGVSDYAVVQWTRDYASLSVNWLDGLGYSLTPSICDSTIVIGRTLVTYDGNNWTAFDSDTVSYPNQTEVSGFAAGPGVATRKITIVSASTTSYVYDLLAYDPNTASWAVPAAMSIAAASGAAGFAAPQCHALPSNFAVVDSVLYARAPDASWQNAGTLAIGSAADAASLCLSGAGYAIFQTASGGAASQVVSLLNGAATAPVALAGQQISVAGRAADYLVGERMFFSYAGNFSATPTSLNLHRLVRGAVSGPQTVYAAATLSLDSGYQSEIAAFSYQASRAVAQLDGWTAAMQQTTRLNGATTVAGAAIGPQVEQFFNGLTPAEAAGIVYPTGGGSNAPGYYGLVRGLCYDAASFSKASPTANPVQQTTSWWAVAVAQIGGAALSSFARAVQTQVARDGVAATTVNQYDANGFVSQAQTECYNAAGHQILTTTAITRWPQIYDPSATSPAPLLEPAVQTIFSTRDATAGTAALVYQIDITTWSNRWPGSAGAWAPFKTFSAFNATPATFSHWNDTDPFTPDANGWRQTSVVLARTPSGLELETADVDQLRTSRIYDRDGLLPVAISTNADGPAGELSYFGFETYEAPGPWRWAPSGTLAAHIISSDRNTGSRCLAIPTSAGGAAGPIAAFYPQQQSGGYVFSAWAKLSAVATTGAAAWRVQAYRSDDNSAAGAPLSLDMSQTGPVWTLCQMLIDLAAIRQRAGIADTVQLYLVVTGGNSLANATCMVDDLRFSPLNGQFGATVYDAETHLRLATLDGNSQVRRTLYDAFETPFAAIGTGNRVEEATLISFSRSLSGLDAFLPDFANIIARLSSGASTYYDDFYSAQTGQWTYTDAANWAIASGALRYAGQTSVGLGATATYSRQAFTNMAGSVEIASCATATNIAIGNGDLFVRWNAATPQWELVRLAGTTVTVLAANAAVGLQRRLTIIIVDGYVMAFAGGTQLFSYAYFYPDPIPAHYGKFAIATTGPAAFDNVAVFDDPSLIVETRDGLGRSLQSLSLIGYISAGRTLGGYPAQSAGTLLDSVGRPSILRNASQGPLQIGPLSLDGGPATGPALLLAAPGDNLYADDEVALSVDQYLNGYAGFYDYTEQTFEDAALSRPTVVTLPRSTQASAADYAVTLQYSGEAALPVGSPPGGPALRYFVERTTQLFAIRSDATRVTTTNTRHLDMDGRVLLEEMTVSDGSLSQKQGYVYDDVGRLITLRQPNAYDPPAGSAAATWQRSFRYTFEGWVAGETDPDAGSVQFLYDRAGRLRFWMTAAGGALTPPRILYRKYDTLSRITETGFVQDAAYTFTGIAAKADVPAFPQIVAASPSGPLQAIGAWTYRYSYDATATGAIGNMIGRLWRVEINNGDPASPDAETFAYDSQGNTLSVTALVNSYAAGRTFVISYAYNNRDQVASITYPDKLAGKDTPFAVGYYYDRLGRLASVGLPVPEGGIIDPDNPPTPPESAFAVYAYDTAGRLAGLQLNNVPDLDAPQPPVQRLFDYDAAGRLSQVADRYGTQTFSYDQTAGADGSRYFNGLVAGLAQQTLAGPLWPCPVDAGQTTLFGYDGLGRLTASVSDRGWPFHTTTGAAGYDANGNMLTRTIGTAQQTFTFRQVANVRVNNQVNSINATATAAASINFEGLPPAAMTSGPWSWGSTNAGSSGSHISSNSPHGGTQCLYLAGGSLGHGEQLLLSSYLDPRGVYALGGYTRTDSGFDAAPGSVDWCLTVRGAEGVLLLKTLGTIAASSGWIAFGPLTVDLSPTIASLGGDGVPVTIALSLMNFKRGANGGTGPGVYVDDITLTGTATGAAYGYDVDGRVTAAPARGLFAIDYEPVTDRTRSIQLGSAAGDRLVYGFDSSGGRLTARRTSADGSTTRRRQASLRGTGSEPLFVQSNSGAGDAKMFRILGLNGLVACGDGTKWSYALTDRLGSTQMLLDQTSTVTASLHYQPFGPLAQVFGTVDTATLFAGQTRDPDTGLYDFHARLYDQDLGRFYATDPQRQYASPYLYAGNDPVNMVDPGGEFAITVAGAAWIAGKLVIGVGKLAAGYYAGSQLTSTRLWDVTGAQSAFNRVVSDDLVKRLNSGNVPFYLNLPGIRAIAINVGRVLFNFSREEYKAVMGVYPWTGPVMWPQVLWNVYRATQEDINRNWGADGWGNAARHFFWMARAERFGGRALSMAIADAHEHGRPGTGHLGFYDNIADKINNVLGWRYAAESGEDLQDIYQRLRDGRLLALSGEGSQLFAGGASQSQQQDAFQLIIGSYARSLAHLESRFNEKPEFSDLERAFLCKAIGWSANGNCPP